MEPLQYERTGAVFWNAGDLNRIEEWTAYLAGVLDSLGYQVLVRTRQWTAADIPWKPEIDRIRKNIQKAVCRLSLSAGLPGDHHHGQHGFRASQCAGMGSLCHLHLVEPNDGDLLALRLIFS